MDTPSARSEFEAAVMAAMRDLRTPTATRSLLERRAQIMAAGDTYAAAAIATDTEEIR